MPKSRQKKSAFERLTRDEIRDIENRAINWFLRRLAAPHPRHELRINPEDPPPIAEKTWTPDELRKLADSREQFDNYDRGYWERRRKKQLTARLRQRQSQAGQRRNNQRAADTKRFMDFIDRQAKSMHFNLRASTERWLERHEPSFSIRPESYRKLRINSKIRLFRKHRPEPR